MIEAEKAHYPVRWMCQVLDVPRSSFYGWRERASSVAATAARRRRLGEQAQRVFDEQRQTAGCRRIAAQLNDEGHPCSVGLIADIMRERGLRAVQPRAYRTTTIPGEQAPRTPDLLAGEFTAEQPGTRLCGDVTYLKTDEGWLYLATVIDLATRMVVGWQMADHMRTTLVIDAVEMARLHGHLTPARCSTPIAEPSTPPGSSRPTANVPVRGSAWAEPGCAGTTPPRSRSSPR